jgi:hypothetical protein
MKRAHMTCGPWTGLRITDDDGNILLHHDANARVALIDRAIDCLRAETVAIQVGGELYAMTGGIQPALTILTAVRDRG